MKISINAPKLLVVPLLLVLAATPSFGSWQLLTNELPEDRSFSRHTTASYANSLWIIAGFSVYRSSDGVHWEFMSFCPARAEVSLVFGGRLWVFSDRAASSTDGISWLSTSSPPCFFGTKGVVQNNYILLTGGGLPMDTDRGGEGEGEGEGEFVPCDLKWTFLNFGDAYAEVWRSLNGRQWPLATGGAEFGMRLLHSAVVHNGHAWVLGGWRNEYLDDVYVEMADVWRSPDGFVWEQVTADAGWPARNRFAAVVFDGKIWVLGGAEFGNVLDDVWTSPDGENWTREVEHEPWGPRYDHTATVHNGKIYIIGGQSWENCPNAQYRDVWVYDPCSGTEGEGEGETPRSVHTADEDGDHTIALGELLRVIQIYNSDEIYCAPSSEDGYGLGPGNHCCAPHASDYYPVDWRITLFELLRLIQLYNLGAYHPCETGEDGFCPGTE